MVLDNSSIWKEAPQLRSTPLRTSVGKTFQYFYMSCPACFILLVVFSTIDARFGTTIYIDYLYYIYFFIKIVFINKSLVVDCLSSSLNTKVQRVTLHPLSLKEVVLAIQSSYLFPISSYGIPRITSYLNFVTLNLSLKT